MRQVFVSDVYEVIVETPPIFEITGKHLLRIEQSPLAGPLLSRLAEARAYAMSAAVYKLRSTTRVSSPSGSPSSRDSIMPFSVSTASLVNSRSRYIPCRSSASSAPSRWLTLRASTISEPTRSSRRRLISDPISSATTAPILSRTSCTTTAVSSQDARLPLSETVAHSILRSGGKLTHPKSPYCRRKGRSFASEKRAAGEDGRTATLDEGLYGTPTGFPRQSRIAM